MQNQSSFQKTRFGIVGGLGPLAGADLFFKLVRATPALRDQDHFDIIIEQHPFADEHDAGQADYNPSRRKFYVYDTIKNFESRGVDCVLLGCFLSHGFIKELQPELRPKILSIFDALAAHLRTTHPRVRRIGILTSDYSRRVGLFEHHLGDWQLLYPDKETESGDPATAIYGARGIKAGNLGGEAVAMIAHACRDLARRGAELIVPGFTEIPIVLAALQDLIDIPILDCNRIYAEYAIACRSQQNPHTGKLGIVGGVGPAATVDFMAKIIRRTRADCDQEHLPMIIEHKPQIPDRTANLVGSGADPTIALYSACRKLEQQGASAIAIPCNTAHAFVDRIQRHLTVPIINMLEETVAHIKSIYPTIQAVGLLATSGTVQSGIYDKVLKTAGLDCLAPEQSFQQLVMAAIYGPGGVKADFDAPYCRKTLMPVINHLADMGATVCILGCTELPLIFTDQELTITGGNGRMVLIDPTEILAARCAALFAETNPDKEKNRHDNIHDKIHESSVGTTDKAKDSGILMSSLAPTGASPAG